MANIFSKISGQFSRVFPPVDTSQPYWNQQAVPTSGAMVNQPQPREINTPTIPSFATPTTPSNVQAGPQRVLPPVASTPTRTLTPSPYVQPPAPQAPTPQPPAKVDPATAFNLLIMDALKKAQSQTSDTDLLKQQRELSRESIRLSQGADVNTTVPGLLGGMSPSQYSSVRNANVNALSSSLDEVAFQLKRLENQKKDLLEQISFAQKGAGDIQNREFEKQKFEETIRHNKESERISGIKADESGTLKETAAEKNALGFYLRGKDAIDTISTLEEKIQNKGLGGQTALQILPNWLQSEDNQIYRQLQRQFTEARLRKESGAAIPTEEYEKDAQTYFAQPGDTSATLERKKNARSVVLESLKIGAGNAYKNYYGVGGDGSIISTTPTTSKFDYLQKDITIQGQNAYLPRSVWDTVKGADKDALIAEAKADGYTLLIN